MDKRKIVMAVYGSLAVGLLMMAVPLVFAEQGMGSDKQSEV